MDDLNMIQHDEDGNPGYHYWDDTSGAVLDPALTKEARKEEIQAIRRMTVYKKVAIAMCLAETGRRPIGTRWVDVNKGDKRNPGTPSTGRDLLHRS